MNRTPYTAGQAVDQNLIGKDGKYYYTGVYGKLLADVDDFKITINSLSIDDINSAFNGASATPDAAAAAANSFTDYDMLIIGFDPVINAISGWGVPASLVNALAACSLMQHFDAMRRGVIDFYDIGYYAGVIVFMLAAAHVVTDNRKAS